MSDSLDGHGSAGATVVRLAAWAALAYLGYWLALLIDRGLAPCLARVLHKAELLDVRVSPLSISLAVLYKDSLSARALLSSAPILASASLWLALWWGGRHRTTQGMPEAAGNHPTGSALALWAGLWTVLQFFSQLGMLAWIGRGPLAILLATFAEDGLPRSLRVRLAAVCSLVLLGAGTMCARRLLRVWHQTVLFDPDSKARPHSEFVATLGLGVPVVFLLISRSATDWPDGLGPRLILQLIAPAAALFLILFAGSLTAWYATSLKGRTAWLPAPFSSKGVITAISTAMVLYFSLSYADATRRWNIESRMASFSSPHYEVLYNESGGRQVPGNKFEQDFAEVHERLLHQQANRLHVSLQNVRVRIVLYSSIDALRAATRDPRPYVVEGTTIRALLPGDTHELDSAADAQALLVSVWGKPGSPETARWVARWVAGTWRNQPLAAWRARFENEEEHRTVAELFNGGTQNQISPLEREPLLGYWLEVIAKQYGLSGAQKIYGSGPKTTLADVANALGTTVAQLEMEWAAGAPPGDTAAVLASDAPRPLAPDFYFRGISFSHEGWRNGRGGYASKQAQAQLERIRALGANAVALVPYGFISSASERLVRYTTTDESDLDLTAAAAEAHRLGMKVMLKPQLWVTSGQFTGDLRIDDDAGRARWMKSYREFILHYARLAQLEGFDLLCIGTELEGLTEHAEDWRKLIGDIRRVYRGPLTYAAHFGQEFETLRFWDALDTIGLNNYYPLANEPIAHAEQLFPRAEALAAKLEAISARWHKPILFTEAGFPSVRGGVAQPWIEDEGRAVSLEEQAAGYEAIFRAFTGRPWFRGMFWWKWPSNGEEGGRRDASFSLAGKPAEEVVRPWFRQMQNNPASVNSAVGRP